MVTVQDTWDLMAKVFNPVEAKKFTKKIVLTYNVGGENGGTWQLIMENGAYKVIPIPKGTPLQPATATMNYRDAESLYKLTTGEMSGIKGYTTGAIKFSGPRPLLESMPKVFPGGKP